MREGLILNEKAKQFLQFDLGRMDPNKFQNKILDIPYCKDLKLDIYYPPIGEGPFPVILAIYGGGYVSGFKQDKFVEPMIAPIQFGYAVVVADYSLALEAVFPAQIFELKTAVRFIKSEAKNYNFDPDNIILWGESAGAHLALLVGFSQENLEDKGLGYSSENSNVRSIVAFYPPTNPLTNDAQRKSNPNYSDRYEMMEDGSIFSLFIGCDPLENLDVVNQTMVKSYLHKKIPPLFIQHGKADNVVPYQQSNELIKEVQNYLSQEQIFLQLVEGAEHADPWFFTLNNIETMIRFIEKVSL